jgi:hypothetical protein
VRRDVLVALGLCGAMITMNVLRLGLLAQNSALYNYWHQDVGGTILAMLQTAVIVLLAFWGARARERSA